MNWVLNLLMLLAAAATAFAAPGEEAAENLPQGAGRIVLVENPKATHAFTPQPAVVSEMLRNGLTSITGKMSVAEAWRSLLASNDIVGIKVYSGPGRNSGTRISLVSAL